MRLFLAFPLPAAVREAVGETIGRLRGVLHGWRFSRLEQVHLTMRFLGECDPGELEGQAPVWGEAAHAVGPFRLALSSLSAFPSPRRARVIWLGVGEEGPGGALERLYEELEQRARELGFKAEDRPFRPHLTLGRSRNPRRLPDLEGYAPEPIVFEADILRLYRSFLGPRGARHEELALFPLAGRGGCPDADGVST